MSLTCQRCAVWRPVKEVSFGTRRGALEHAALYHPNKLIDAILDFDIAIAYDIKQEAADRIIDAAVSREWIISEVFDDSRRAK